jgi:hypothetical protein
MIIGQDWQRETITFDLTANSGWNNFINLDQYWARPNWISLTPFESFLAGGNNQWGDHQW